MADIIKLLPDHVANQIAAGEVVQRPASVVKELMENAIDAGAESIKLIIKDGGKTLIQVVDDGLGMSETDARLSFERHATSKISSAQDLFNLNTKGFRGEALASIAAIAHVDMQTRTASNDVGTHLKIEGSKIVSQEVVATPKGTSILVKNLFFNIPARRNFLKSNQVELRHITDEFHRVALVHPNIEFHFYNNGSEIFNLPKTKHRQRIAHIFGSRMETRLVPVNEETEVLKVSGFICKPEFAKKSRGEQFFFANNRYIKSPYLHHAVSAAFEGLIKSEMFPGYFLYLEVDPGSIDINIHPTKTEVKFDDENTLYAILRSTIKHSLGQFNVAPVLDFEHDPNLDTPYNYKEKGAVLPKVTVDSNFNPFQEVPKSKSSGGGTFQKQSTKGWENLYEGLEQEVDVEQFSSLVIESESDEQGTLYDSEQAEEHMASTFQLRRKYVVSTVKSGMLVIHQKRAHERILFEKFLKEITVKEGVSQQLLFPLELSFNKQELGILNDISESLTNIGFAFESLEHETVKVTGVPLLVPESGIGTVLDRLIADYREGYGDGSISQAEMLAEVLSRNLAVKTGEVLDQESQMALVNNLFACKEPTLSPSQKITYTIISEGDIDKKFS
ncbi:DNA mismatch repair endonuclease MutL [Flagellimonas zhangzhouensis]|uniref:DNA mismatch repair protein MutL n=1 Tax=Flagellimonas zhangzhouensis TaxID=1073328 RepID=A0A1H2R5U6_9FLAO|nr:DNA mismatch repair endonuclease MutL [Allomuricauda zhangzhouensis]SDQ59812.1 DNA mismatch repair protein MutL [Allomuricauda zhangzhouensis]SDW14500.1 DNA mismatch repair protein MutL [Allomuricauda zhangzhouensis]